MQVALEDGEAREQGHGLRVIAVLAALTAVEFAIAVGLNSTEAIVALLIPIGLAKALAIVQHFMHVARVWRDEQAHS